MTNLYLGLIIFSFVINSLAIVPFIGFLYKIKFQRQKQKTIDFQNKRTVTFDKFHSQKQGTPVGGGILIIGLVTVLFLAIIPVMQLFRIFISQNYNFFIEVFVVFFTFLSFGLLGLYDDLLKFFGFAKTGFFGLRMKHKLILQFVLATIIACLIYFLLKISFIYLPFLGPIRLGLFFIPVSVFFIVSFSNFFNITDGLDGLSCGLLLIALFAFSVLAGSSFDTPISIFISLWIGGLLAFLYFNTWPARIWLGDMGALSFGATLAVIAIILGKIIPLTIVGGIFIIEGLSSAIQIFSKKYYGKKVFPAAPIHLTLQKSGWEEPKIVSRAWLAGLILAIFGLWLGLN